jgi:hypothetical protein
MGRIQFLSKTKISYSRASRKSDMNKTEWCLTS